MMRATHSTASAKLDFISDKLWHNSPELSSFDHKINGVIQQRESKLQVNKIEEISQ